MSNIRYNKSKTYLLPLLSELVFFDKKFWKSLINTYMFEDTGRYKDCLLVLHDFSFRNPEYTHYENQLVKNEYFVDLYDINDKVLYIFKFPDEYMHEYNCLLEGRYSHYGVDAKELILEYFTDVYQGNPNAIPFLLKVKQILFKDEKLKEEIEDNLKIKLDKDAELQDIIDIENETFKLSEYIKNDESKNKEVTSRGEDTFESN